MRYLILFLIVSLTLQAQQAQPEVKAQVEKIVTAAGGADKLLKLFRIEEVFHFGETPEPAAGKQRSKRSSVIEPPALWWIGKKERAEEPAKWDVWGWTLGALLAPNSEVTTIPAVSESGKPTLGLRIRGSIQPAMDLHFDTSTHLLTRMDWRGDVYRFTDWKEADGARYPAKCIIYKSKTEKPWFYHEITKLERLSTLPAGLSREPAPAAQK